MLSLHANGASRLEINFYGTNVLFANVVIQGQKTLRLAFAPIARCVRRCLGELFIIVIGSGWSHAGAYDLGRPKCGGEYGGLNLTFSSGASISSLKTLSKQLPWLNSRFPLAQKGKFSTLYYEIKEALQRSPNAYSERYDINAPIGSEQYVAEQLIEHKFISKATHPNGVCGGADISYFVHSYDYDIYDPARFSALTRNIVKQYTERDKGAIFTVGRSIVSPVEPHSPMQTFTIIVPSTLSRGPDAVGTWDRFDAVFALAGKKDNKYFVAVFTEGLHTAPLVAFNKKAPTVEFFNSKPSESSHAVIDYQAEMVAAAGITSFAGGLANCKAETDGYFASDEGPFRCRYAGHL